jgi:uncharacterized protein YjiS (DUF1127 family)
MKPKGHAMFAARTAPGLFSPRGTILARLRATLAARRQRRSLATLDARMLRDIGITPEQARAEATRSPWDVPAHWLR